MRRLGDARLLLLALSLLTNIVLGVFAFRNNSSDTTAANKSVTVAHATDPEKPTDIRSRISLLQMDAIPPSLTILRTAVLNTLVDRYHYRSYLEIGQGKRADNLDWIQCYIKIGVDPLPKFNAAYQMTSDSFFAVNKDTYDLIFIDGLHYAYQVEKDIHNALKVLNENGTIVVHDCNPTTREMQSVPPVKVLTWTGDVWKAWMKMRATRADLQMYVVDTDYGCGIIRKGRQKLMKIPESLSYEQLDQNRAQWLNLIDVDTFLKDLKRDPHV